MPVKRSIFPSGRRESMVQCYRASLAYTPILFRGLEGMDSGTMISEVVKIPEPRVEM